MAHIATRSPTAVPRHGDLPAPPVEATLSLIHPDLQPDLVTRMLGVEPYAAYAAGGVYRRTPRSRPMRTKTGLWLVTSQDVAEPDPTRHLEALIALLAPHVPAIERRFPGVRVVFSLMLNDASLSPADLDEAVAERVLALGSLILDEDGVETEYPHGSAWTPVRYGA